MGSMESVAKVTLNIRPIPDTKVDPVLSNNLPPFLSMNEYGMNMIPIDFDNFKQGNNLKYSLDFKDPTQ